MTDDDLKHAESLKNVLKNESYPGAIEVFHRFIKPFMYPCENGESSSKWNNVAECLHALCALKDDGNFIQAKDQTQKYAQQIYVIRGTILFEGLLNAKNSNMDLYKWVEINLVIIQT